MIRVLARCLVVFLALLVVLIPLAWFVLLRPVTPPAVTDPQTVFDHGSIGNEAAQGLPYWIWRVLPTMFPDYLPGDHDGYRAFGVYWATGEELPVGFSKKTLGIIPRVAPNCAFCHQGSFRLHAGDPPTLVVAGPGTRVNVQAFLRFLVKAGTDPKFTSDNVMAAIAKIDDMPLWERMLYRYLLVPAVKSAFQDQAARFAWTDKRPDWGPGRIDPFNPVKFYNLHLPDDGTIGNSDMMPLWDLDRTASDTTRPYSVHWDGLSTSLRETVIAGAIGDGMSYQALPDTLPNLDAIMTFIRTQKPPPSPFSTALPADNPYHLDEADVEAGKALYQVKCAECHEPGGKRYRTAVPVAEVGTDRHRLDMWTLAAKERYMHYEEGYDWGFQAFHKTDGYLANELTGLWLRGPYLHNGSVPTLRDLLLPPAERPKSFYRGYDLVDPVGGGFASQTGTPAERFGTLYDTSVPGNGNGGHLYGTDLSDQEKRQLLAFLKTL
jgi:hypothetical protein